MPHGMTINNVMSNNMELKEFSREEFNAFLEKNYKSAIGKVRIGMYCDYPDGDKTLFLLCDESLRFDPAYLCRKLVKEYNVPYLYFNGKCYTRKWFEKHNWELK